jgi:hypothetical protein
MYEVNMKLFQFAMCCFLILAILPGCRDKQAVLTGNLSDLVSLSGEIMSSAPHTNNTVTVKICLTRKTSDHIRLYDLNSRYQSAGCLSLAHRGVTLRTNMGIDVDLSNTNRVFCEQVFDLSAAQRAMLMQSFGEAELNLRFTRMKIKGKDLGMFGATGELKCRLSLGANSSRGAR